MAPAPLLRRSIIDRGAAAMSHREPFTFWRCVGVVYAVLAVPVREVLSVSVPRHWRVKDVIMPQEEEENRTKDGGVTADAAADPFDPHQEDEASPPIADEEDVNSSVVEVVARPPSFISNQVVSPAFKRETDGPDFPQTFPQKLFEILSNDDFTNIIGWLPHGKGFIIKDKRAFADKILPTFFKKAKFTSFTRKLNRWSFTRVTRGPETGAYYHPQFQRGNPKAILQMSCISKQVQPMDPVALGMHASMAAQYNASAMMQQQMLFQQYQAFFLQQMALAQQGQQQQMANAAGGVGTMGPVAAAAANPGTDSPNNNNAKTDDDATTTKSEQTTTTNDGNPAVQAPMAMNIQQQQYYGMLMAQQQQMQMAAMFMSQQQQQQQQQQQAPQQQQSPHQAEPLKQAAAAPTDSNEDSNDAKYDAKPDATTKNSGGEAVVTVSGTLGDK